MGDLRDMEEVVPNRRLSKHQLTKDGFEFDIYTERHAALVVPYDAVRAASSVVGGIRTAALEHLLILKLDAFADRRASSKGDKDAKDLLRIAAVAARGDQPLRRRLALPYLRDEHLDLLSRVESGPHAISLAHGNAKVASGLRKDLRATIAALGAKRNSRSGR
jgi:hypothetical protein